MSLVAARRRGKVRKWRQSQSVVTPEAIERYIARANKDHDYVKEYKRSELIKLLPELELHTKPRLHQLQALYLTTYYRSLLLYLDMGAGKTKVILDTIRFRKKHHGLRSTLVITLNLTSAYTWAAECDKHAPDLKYTILDGPKSNRIELVETETPDLFITNYHSLPMLLCERIPKANSRERAFDFKARPKFLRRLIPKVNCLVVDEVHMISNPNGLFWRLANSIGQDCAFRYALSGTAFDRDPAPLFGQFKLIDHGETFGETIGAFHTVFYDWKQGFFGGKWVFNEKTMPQVARMARNRAITYTVDEFTDLPPITFQTITCKQTKDMKSRYDKLVAAVQHESDRDKLEAAFVNMRQCTSGYQTLVNKVGEDDRELELLGLKTKKRVRSYVEFTRNPKMEALTGLVLGLATTEKFIIFCEYKHSVRMVAAMLERSKIKHKMLFGETQDKKAALDIFYRDPTCRGLVANNMSAAMSINPQYVCRYGIFYESPVRPSIRAQAERRLHRTGQERPVIMYDIVVANSVDQRVAAWVREGKDLLEMMMSNPEELLA